MHKMSLFGFCRLQSKDFIRIKFIKANVENSDVISVKSIQHGCNVDGYCVDKVKTV